MAKLSFESLEDHGEITTSSRELPGKWKLLVYIIGIIASLFHIWVNTIGVCREFTAMPFTSVSS